MSEKTHQQKEFGERNSRQEPCWGLWFPAVSKVQDGLDSL